MRQRVVVPKPGVVLVGRDVEVSSCHCVLGSGALLKTEIPELVRADTGQNPALIVITMYSAVKRYQEQMHKHLSRVMVVIITTAMVSSRS